MPNLRALLFEDHDCTRLIVGSQLADAGYTVESHTSPGGYVRRPDLAARLQDVHIVWTDGSMPDMHGTEAAVTLRENGYQGVIILCSGDSPHEFERYQRSDFASGNWRGPVFDLIYAKPLDLYAIGDIVRELKEFQPFRPPKRIYTTG